MLHAGVALLLLLVATTLALYKPQGMSRYGARKHHEERNQCEAEDRSAGSLVFSLSQPGIGGADPR